MSNYPLYDVVAVQHREELLREAERERLVREATSPMVGSTRHVLRDFGRLVLSMVRHSRPGGAAAQPEVRIGAPVAHQ